MGGRVQLSRVSVSGASRGSDGPEAPGSILSRTSSPHVPERWDPRRTPGQFTPWVRHIVDLRTDHPQSASERVPLGGFRLPTLPRSDPEPPDRARRGSACRTHGTRAAPACWKQPASPRWVLRARGISFCLGLPDHEGVLTREAALEETIRIAGAVRIPVSVDAENGYGHTRKRWPRPSSGWRTPARSGRASKTIPPPMAPVIFTIGCGRWRESRRRWRRLLPCRFPIYPDRESRVFSLGSPEPIRGIRGPGRFLSGRGGGLSLRARNHRRGAIGALVKEVNAPVNVVHGSCWPPDECEPARGPGGKASEYRAGRSPVPPSGSSGERPRRSATTALFLMRKDRCRTPNYAGSLPPAE